MRNVGWVLILTCSMSMAAEPQLERITVDAPRGTASAVVVPTSLPLIHTEQIWATDAKGHITSEDASQQFALAFKNVATVLERNNSTVSNIVRLNVYAANTEAAASVQACLAKHLSPAQPAFVITYVVGRLPHEKALVGLDAIAWSKINAERVKYHTTDGRTAAATLPPGPRVYIAGQAEKGATPAEATRKTLASLRATLTWMKLTDADIVHAKCFLTPITAVNDVVAEFEAFYGKGKSPPISFVEWTSTLPIEIELVVAATSEKDRHGVQFLTPPGMTASPVYARVTRLQAEKVIYLAGLTAKDTGNGEAQVKDVFAQMDEVLKKTQSDWKHLVKATYYVSDNDVSQKLNELRPKYYDPHRPPAASKAHVAGTGFDKRTITVDMIAVPTQKP